MTVLVGVGVACVLITGVVMGREHVRRGPALYVLLLALVAGSLLGAALLGAERAPAPKEAGPVTFADVATAALIDAKGLPPDAAARTRYLSAAHLPAAEARELLAVVSYHVNGVSRGREIRAPRQVTAWLWAVDLDHYKWDAKVWEKLKEVNHYFCIPVQQQAAKTVTKTRPKKVGTYSDGSPYYQGTEEYTETVTDAAKEDFIPAPWLPPATSAAIVQLTGSVTAIVRADEFLFQTMAQADDRPVGYYDLLGLGKNLADAEQLATLDRKKAIDANRELAATVNKSGVALKNRQLFRFGTVSGSWWESRDAKKSVRNKNAVVNKLDDFKADAFEIVFSLPNGLPGYYLANDKGERQDTAPDFIASHHTSTNNDKRVHVGYSCVACHTDGGLRSISDYTRRVYDPKNGLAVGALALDVKTAERIEAAYLGPLKKWYDRDAGDFTEAIDRACGLKPDALSAAVTRQWTRYLDESVTTERAAAECGVTSDQLRGALVRYATQKGVVNEVVLAFVGRDPQPVDREQFEEVFPIVMLALGGVNP